MPARPSCRTAIALTAVILALLAVSLPGGANARSLSGPLLTGRRVIAPTSPTARIARSDESLLRLRGNAPIAVMVRFDVDPIASYAGGIAGLQATSPGLMGPLHVHPAGVRAYERFVTTRMATIAGAIRRTVPAARLLRTFSIVYGGASLLVPAGQIRDLLTVPGVVAVQRDRLAHTASTTTRFLGADRVWPSLGGPQLAANDVVVGVIDTGIWPEHPSFADLGLGSFPLAAGCEFGDGSDPDLGAPFDCGRKLIGAYAFTDTYMSLVGAQPGEFCDNETGRCSARSGDGHGTHTASTAAGSPTKASVFGLPRGRVSGVAPGARLIAYRVCLSLGCYSSDSVSAIEQAVLDGVDVINFSISGGEDPYSDPVELAFLDAYAAGIEVNASAGNAGPGPGTADHGGPWVTTVGASYGPRAYMTALRLRGPDGETVRLPGSTITRGVAGKTVVSAADVAGYEDPLCSSPMDPGTVTDRVVVCSRGKVPRVEKSWNVRRGGGAGMILFNPTHEDLFTDNFWIPTVMLDGPEPANTLLAFLRSQASVISTWRTGTATSNHADQMTLFSARGPVGGFIKPDVTAPGLQVLAGAAPEPADPAAGPRGQLFQSIAGTSMSSPYAAGVAALVRASHPGWSAGQVKSALMTSALQTVTKEDGTTGADPFDGGAGSIRADRAVRPTLTFDVPAADYVAATDPLGWVDLNLPSIDAIGIREELSTVRYGRNVSGSAQTFSASVTGPVGATITVTSPDWRVGSGGTLEIDVRIDGGALADGQYFGGITLEPASTAHEIFLPVAFTTGSGSMRSDGSDHVTIGPAGTAGPLRLVASGMPTPIELASIASEAALIGGTTILAAGRTRDGVEKAAGDYVTAVDGASERAIAGFLLGATPDIPLVGEERGGPTSDRYWLVDPLDGTTNFLHGFPIVAVSVALVEAGQPTVGVVHAPFLQETYVAASGLGATVQRPNGPVERLAVSTRTVERSIVGTGFPFRRKDVLPRYYRALYAALERFEDLRRPGAAALDLAWVAAGVFDGFFELALGPWDVAAGTVLIREAGGTVTDWAGAPDILSGDIVAGPPAVHAELLRIAADT